MSKTYDPVLSTEKDFVRAQIGDKRVGSMVLEDQEIEALLEEEENKYLAAARAGELILNRGGAAVSKSVADLSLSWSDNPEGAYGAHLKKLRERGCELLMKRSGSSILRVL